MKKMNIKVSFCAGFEDIVYFSIIHTNRKSDFSAVFL